VYAFPLRLRQETIGALNLFRAEPGAFDDADISTAQALADVATIGILQERKVTRAEDRADQLQHALHSRVVIEQAKGILAERWDVRPDEAFDALRRYARRQSRRLHDVARQVIAGSVAIEPPGSDGHASPAPSGASLQANG
jgi:hypothetical protein